MATVSAALIVRDEEAHIGACLASLSGAVGEIVVVDTGSGDRTAEIALAHGARLFREPWNDDFSQARNAALRHASGDWILYVDADERVRLTGHLASALDDPTAVAACVRFRASTQLTPYREHRLFRNRADIRFRGIIHETVMPDIQAVIANESARVIDAPLFIEHLGYHGNLERKHRRNLPLLRRAVDAEPDRVYLWHALGEAELGLGGFAEAQRAWRQGLQRVRRRQPRPGDVQIYSDLLDTHFAGIGTPLADVTELVEEAVERHPDDPLVLWWSARHQASRGCFGAARCALEQLLRCDPEGPLGGALGYDRRLFGAFAWGLMGVCWLREGEPARALEWLRRAESADPDDHEIRTKRALAEGVMRSAARNVQRGKGT